MKILSKFPSQNSLPPSLHKPILPKFESSAKLFLTGATLGPVVDSFHNQCLLIYDRAPIYVPSSVAATDTYLFCSSWYIPPLLGFAYVVLGAILPRLIQRTIVAVDGGGKEDYGYRTSTRLRSLSSSEENSVVTPLESQRQIKIWPFVTQTPESDDVDAQTPLTNDERGRNESRQTILRGRAILAVTSTALIIKLSAFLQTNPSFSSTIQETIAQVSGVEIPTNTLNLGVMIAAAMTQWVTLDRTLYALLTALLVGIGGPLSELPFIQFGFWHYIPDAADYTPIEELITWLRDFSSSDIGIDSFIGDYSNLAISSITGPCYFAVTMDAIALGRWLENDPNDGIDIST